MASRSLSPFERDVRQLLPVRPAAYFLGRPFQAANRLVAKFIGASLRDKLEDASPPANYTWISLLCLNAAIALFLMAAGQGAGRHEAPVAPLIFWSGVILLLFPTAGRIASPALSRAERLFLLVLLSEALFFFKLLYAPTSFVHFDEFLHWISAYDVLFRHRLFLGNSLLPISPAYPGLELLTTALANLTGLSIFFSYVLTAVVLKAVFISALFLFFEKITGSARLAALAALIYMGNASFAVFDSQFAYQSLAIVLCALVMLTESEMGRLRQQGARGLLFLAMLIGALAITHHLSAFACAAYLVSLAIIETMRRDDSVPLSKRIWLPAAGALLGLALPLLWIYAKGIQISDYFGPVLELGAEELRNKLYGLSGARKLFVAADGTVQPIFYRLAGILSTLLIALGLATGFFRTLALAAEPPPSSGWDRVLKVARLRWRESRILLLALAAFAFPVSVALRLTSSAWEIGNRMSSFVFIAAGLVVAVSIVHFWQTRATWWNLLATNLAIGTILLGGITTGAGLQAIRGGYKVGADAESIEPMGIGAALWARTWLGEGNRFAADRTNRILLASYGQQHVVTTIANGVDESRIFLSDALTPDTLYPIKDGQVDYLLVDLRLSTAPALLGHYFEQNEQGHGRPPSVSKLLKFDTSNKAGRIFDNGWTVIFDVRALHDDGR